MYINKMVFVDNNPNKEFSKLNAELDIIQRTSYGTFEVSSELIKLLLSDVKSNIIEHGYSLNDFEFLCQEFLGSDVYEALKEGAIDFAQVIVEDW